MIGVLVGAVASSIGGALMERSRWRRQLSTRWDERRLECYLRYADAIKKFTSLAGRLAASKGLFDLPQPLAEEAGLELLAEAELERGYAFEAVLLMGDAESISAARALQRHAWALERLVRDMRPGTPDDWMRALREFQEKRDEFYIAARNSLGVHADFRLRSEDPPILSPDPRPS
ncbi:hypothetical protein ABTX80_30140 [Streptomyces erythrochromogenes]|uniref:hypothetical protein n=1 Tax=Streptomyces erythrochromogenes TaxID=285574 RepID=UPI0033339DA4